MSEEADDTHPARLERVDGSRRSSEEQAGPRPRRAQQTEGLMRHL